MTGRDPKASTNGDQGPETVRSPSATKGNGLLRGPSTKEGVILEVYRGIGTSRSLEGDHLRGLGRSEIGRGRCRVRGVNLNIARRNPRDRVLLAAGVAPLI